MSSSSSSAAAAAAAGGPEAAGAAAGGPAAMAQLARPVNKAIQEVIMELDNIKWLVDASQEKTPGDLDARLFQHIGNLTSGLQSIDEASAKLQGLEVPEDLLDHIDRVEYCNPDLYTRHKVHQCHEEKERKRRIGQDFAVIKRGIKRELSRPQAPATAAAVAAPASAPDTAPDTAPGAAPDAAPATA